MKKFFLFFILILLTLPAEAKIQYQCVVEPYPVGNKASSFVNTVTGANFIGRKTVEKIIKSNLKKSLNADFDIKLTPFNTTDLVAGKFQSLTFSTKEVNLGGVYVHDFQGQTQCGYNRIVFQKDQPPKIYEDFLVDFSARITNNDLQNTMQLEDFQKYIGGLNLRIGKFSMLKVENPKLSIIDDKLRYNFRLMAPVILADFSQDISCDMGLTVRNGKLAFSSIRINNKVGLPPEIIAKMVNRINPFKINLEKALKISSYLDIDSVKIVKNEIFLNGTFIAPKNVTKED